MNKQEIQSKLNEMTKRRMEISDNILWLKEQLAEAEKLEKLDKFLEKPKLRNGDYGLNKDGNSRIRLFKDSMPDRGKSDDYSPYGIVSDSDITIFGNVFDLMKGWDKPFEELDCGVAGGVRIIDKTHIGLYACTGGKCSKKGDICHYNIETAEKFHNALGHAIADLKRKQGD